METNEKIVVDEELKLLYLLGSDVDDSVLIAVVEEKVEKIIGKEELKISKLKVDDWIDWMLEGFERTLDTLLGLSLDFAMVVER